MSVTYDHRQQVVARLTSPFIEGRGASRDDLIMMRQSGANAEVPDERRLVPDIVDGAVVEVVLGDGVMEEEEEEEEEEKTEEDIAEATRLIDLTTAARVAWSEQKALIAQGHEPETLPANLRFIRSNESLDYLQTAEMQADVHAAMRRLVAGTDRLVDTARRAVAATAALRALPYVGYWMDQVADEDGLPPAFTERHFITWIFHFAVQEIKWKRAWAPLPTVKLLPTRAEFLSQLRELLHDEDIDPVVRMTTCIWYVYCFADAIEWADNSLRAERWVIRYVGLADGMWTGWQCTTPVPISFLEAAVRFGYPVDIINAFISLLALPVVGVHMNEIIDETTGVANDSALAESFRRCANMDGSWLGVLFHFIAKHASGADNCTQDQADALTAVLRHPFVTGRIKDMEVMHAQKEFSPMWFYLRSAISMRAGNYKANLIISTFVRHTAVGLVEAELVNMGEQEKEVTGSFILKSSPERIRVALAAVQAEVMFPFNLFYRTYSTAEHDRAKEEFWQWVTVFRPFSDPLRIAQIEHVASVYAFESEFEILKMRRFIGRLIRFDPAKQHDPLEYVPIRIARFVLLSTELADASWGGQGRVERLKQTRRDLVMFTRSMRLHPKIPDGVADIVQRHMKHPGVEPAPLCSHDEFVLMLENTIKLIESDTPITHERAVQDIGKLKVALEQNPVLLGRKTGGGTDGKSKRGHMRESPRAVVRIGLATLFRASFMALRPIDHLTTIDETNLRGFAAMRLREYLADVDPDNVMLQTPAAESTEEASNKKQRV